MRLILLALLLSLSMPALAHETNPSDTVSIDDTTYAADKVLDRGIQLN